MYELNIAIVAFAAGILIRPWFDLLVDTAKLVIKNAKESDKNSG